MTAATKNVHGRFYLISYPRTCSNLLVKILSMEEQPGFASGEHDGGYFFVDVYNLMQERGLRSKSLEDWTNEDRAAAKECYQACFENLQQWLHAREDAGQSVFVKEHITFLADPGAWSRSCFGGGDEEPAWMVNCANGSHHSDLNATVLPDEFLATWSPTFLIRHPAIAFPSMHRAIVKMEGEEAAQAGNCASLGRPVKWTRELYDFLAQQQSTAPGWPIVLDGDDIVAAPEAVVGRYCDVLGLDRHKLRFSWDQVAADKVDDARKVLRSTLWQSTGVKTTGRTAAGIDIAVEAEKWRDEFGSDVAEHIKKLVQQEMPHYEYLLERRLRIPQE